MIVAGGIGLAPLRPVVLTALADRSRYGRIVLLAGARTPGDLLYADELERWRRDGVEVAVTVDQADSGWNGEVGLVTALIKPAGLAPGNSVAFICGPDIMMRFTADALAAVGIPVTGYAYHSSATCAAALPGAGTASSGRCWSAGTVRWSATTRPRR